MAIMHNSLGELDTDTVVNIVVMAYAPFENQDELLAQGLTPRSAIRYVTVVLKDCPIAAAPYVAGAFRNLSDATLQGLFADADGRPAQLEGLEFIVAGVTLQHWAAITGDMTPTNEAARRARADAQGAVFDPSADA